MPTILQISLLINKGTIGRIAEQIGNNVISHGWESYITYARNDNKSTSKTIKIGNKFDIYWHGINTRLFDNHCFCSINATKKLVKQIEKIKPDIVHVHNLHGYYINLRILFTYLRKSNINVIWTLHDCWSFTGHCTNFDFINCKKWINGCYECPQKRNYPKSIIMDRSKRNYEIKKQYFTSLKKLTIVTVSYWLSELVMKSFLNKYPINVIYNGIDTDVFVPINNTDIIKKKYCLENKIIILGIANKWGERKGLDDFYSLNKIIDHDLYKIILIGLDNKQIKKLPKNIIGIKNIDNNNELSVFYSVADVYLSCSVEETFGLTIIESMACGTPVIAYNCTAIPELIDKNTGFIINKNDINSIYRSIIKIKEKGKSSYSLNCRNKAVNLFSKFNSDKKYYDLYNQIINKC